MEKRNITIFIADDHRLFSHSLQLLINSNTAYTVLNLLGSGKALLHALNDVKPDLIILDINMPSIDGIEILERIRLLYPEIKIFIVSYLKEKHIIKKAMLLGADGYFVKDDDPDLFLSILDRVITGEKCFPENMGTEIWVRFLATPDGKRHNRMGSNYAK